MNLNNADTDNILLGVIYGYCVKYTRMAELININFRGSDATTIDIFVDINDIYRHVLSFMKMKPELHPNNRFFIASGIINLCAHYREFFRSRYSTNSRFWLIDAGDVSNHSMIYKYYSKSALLEPTGLNNIIADNNMVLETLAPYLYDVTFIKSNGFDLGVNILDIITKEPLGNPRMIISKDRSTLLIADSILNTFTLRPKKINPSDESELFGTNVALTKYINVEFQKNCVGIPIGLGSVLSALTKMSSRNIRSKIRIDVIYKKLFALSQSASSLSANNIYPHVWDIKQFMSQLNIDTDPYEIELRYKAIDIPIMYEMFKLNPASKLYNGIVNLYDPKEVQKINEQFFQGIPMDLEVI